jgi:enamine deaminase RidA (YjgF/YER057c/UK114 family)
MQTFIGGERVAPRDQERQLYLCFYASDTLTRRTISSGYPFEDTYGYSRAVRVGDQVFVSGTTARGSELEGDAYVQARAVLGIISDALTQAGAELRHVVRTVVYVIDMSDASLVARAHAEVFGTARPASTLVQVAGLTPSAARVEFEVTAIVAD